MSNSTRTGIHYTDDGDENYEHDELEKSGYSASANNIYDLYKVILEPNKDKTDNAPLNKSTLDEIRANDLINLDLELGMDDIDKNLSPILIHTSSPNNVVKSSAFVPKQSPSSQNLILGLIDEDLNTPSLTQYQSPNLIVVEKCTDTRIIRTTITTTKLNEMSEFIEQLPAPQSSGEQEVIDDDLYNENSKDVFADAKQAVDLAVVFFINGNFSNIFF